jgi:putative transposase
VLLRLAYLGLTNTVALLRLIPMSNRDKDLEILAFAPPDRSTPAATRPHEAAVHASRPGTARRPPSPTTATDLAQTPSTGAPDTILRWHRDLLRRRHATPRRPDRNVPADRARRRRVHRFVQDSSADVAVNRCRQAAQKDSPRHSARPFLCRSQANS